ncbi:hypothetical protein [Nonomuraea sp. NPDC050643]|uniref:hypothetical protein n=1 Tax=Nonomuraea sp. NPDC050643 TaxID=3155660 RepID=UPI0033DE294B
MRWEDVPPHVRDAIVAQIGPVQDDDVQSIPGQPGEFAARMYGRDDDVFVKTLPMSSPHAYLHQRERWAARHMASVAPSAPVPRMLWAMEAASLSAPPYHLSAWELINDHARRADLSRWSADVPIVLEAVTELGKLLTPCPPGAPSIVQRLAGLVARARIMRSSPELRGSDLYTKALNGFIIDRLRGTSLLHANLSPRHLLIKDGGGSVVGWGEACAGQAWIDPALLAPHLVAGRHSRHSPEQVHELLWAIPAWRDAPADLMAGLTALWTLSHLHQGYHADEPDEASARLADAGQEWLAYLVGQI